MKSLVAAVLSIGMLLPVLGVGEVHGPICSWHLDPTSTMTIQWVERVNFPVPKDKWYEAVAGFGYGDNDDNTTIEMQDRFPRLYIRKEFDVKDLPKEAEIDVTGDWKAVAKYKEQEIPIIAEFTLTENKLTGIVKQFGVLSADITSGYVSGNRVYFQFEMNYLKTDVIVDVEAEEKDGKLVGTWVATGKKDNKEIVDGPISIERIPDPKKEKDVAKSEEEKKKEEEEKKKNEKKVFNTDAFEMHLKIRYDDAFVAYLNGEEIARRGVKGSGKDATDIVSHDADKEETIVIDKKLNRFLNEGKNILAIEGHNAKLDSSDFTLDPKFWIKVDKKEHKPIDAKAKWQFFFGDPFSKWKTAEIRTAELPLLSSEKSPYELRFGKRDSKDIKTVRPTPLPFADTRQVVHRVILKGLSPDTGYAFTIHRDGSSDRLKNRKYFFKTAPTAPGEHLSFVTGGDMYKKRDPLDKMNMRCGKENPLFALLGGDLAYANGKEEKRWYDWIDSWHDWAIRTDDAMVPMVVVIGNHECDKNFDDLKPEEIGGFVPEKSAKFFYSLFPLPEGKSNYALDFGKYMSIIILDSNHTQSPEAQVPWLKEALEKRRNVPNLFTCYHRPTYGTLVKDDEMEVRKHFVPLLEKYGVDAVFENDHHMYKRTAPILKGEISKDGVIYMGDGAWAVDLRDVPWDKTKSLKYIARAAKENHLIRVGLYENRQQFDALKANGEPIDSYVRFR